MKRIFDPVEERLHAARDHRGVEVTGGAGRDLRDGSVRARETAAIVVGFDIADDDGALGVAAEFVAACVRSRVVLPAPEQETRFNAVRPRPRRLRSARMSFFSSSGTRRSTERIRTSPAGLWSSAALISAGERTGERGAPAGGGAERVNLNCVGRGGG